MLWVNDENLITEATQADAGESDEGYQLIIGRCCYSSRMVPPQADPQAASPVSFPPPNATRKKFHDA